MSPSASPPLREDLERMARTLLHRGPESVGYYRDNLVGFVHTRLAIVDLVSGDQPLANEDETLWVTFNGEIYNHCELRKELEQKGHRFRSQADTEVILHAYEQWGPDSFRRFNGQWAIGLWDQKSRRLCLCRDRVGVRPLFVAHVAGRLLFASEIKALLASAEIPRSLDPRGLAQVFTYWCSIAPQTVFEGIEELLPGSYRIYREGMLPTEERYWRVDFSHESHRAPATMTEAAEGLRDHLKQAVRLRMTRSDVPVGCYLSGGIDSSVVAGLAHEYALGEFRTFSIRFTDSEFDESAYQGMMARALGSRHDEIVVTQHDIATIFPDVIWHAEQPLLRTAPAPLFHLSRLVRDAGFKAVLTGEGSDEFLGGYDIFREAKIREFWGRNPSSRLRPLLFDRIYPYLRRSPAKAKGMALAFWQVDMDRYERPGYSHLPRWKSATALQRFFADEIKMRLSSDVMPNYMDAVPASLQNWDILERAQFLEIETFFSGYLLSSQGDRMLMANSVEGRFPYLDAEVLQFVMALSPLQKLPGLREKAVLKNAARTIVPEPILQRVKQPYRAPDAICFLGKDAPDWTREYLAESAVRRTDLFEPRAVRGLVAKLNNEVLAHGSAANISNSDNMAFLGILSSQVLHAEFVRATGFETRISCREVPVRVNAVGIAQESHSRFSDT